MVWKTNVDDLDTVRPFIADVGKMEGGGDYKEPLSRKQSWFSKANTPIVTLSKRSLYSRIAVYLRILTFVSISKCSVNFIF